MKAIIDLDWLDSEIESEDYKMKISTHELHVRGFERSRNKLKLVRSKCEPIKDSKEKEMLSLLQRMYDEYSMNERITGSLLKFMIETRELIK
jgi:hypothetical protein